MEHLPFILSFMFMSCFAYAVHKSNEKPFKFKFERDIDYLQQVIENLADHQLRMQHKIDLLNHKDNVKRFGKQKKRFIKGGGK